MQVQRSHWIMSLQQLNAFNAARQCIYKEQSIIPQHQTFKDDLLTQSYLKNFINFLRTRKSQVEFPFKFEKVIHFAVSLFKRYYLVNSYMDEEPTQNLICSVYVAFKMNQYDEEQIRGTANKWREKPVFQPKRGHLHYGDDYYTDKQLKFLSGFRFQTGVSKLIQPIESLYHLIQESGVDKGQIRMEIKNILEQVYLHPNILFINDGPKVGLALIMMVASRRQLDLNKILQEKMIQLIKKHKDELETLIDQLNTIQDNDYKQAHHNGLIHQMRKATKKSKFKKPEMKKVSQSPKFHPRTDSLPSRIESFSFQN